MAVLAAPSSVEHFVQGHHDITKLKSGLPTYGSMASTYSPRMTMKGFHDTSPQTSGRSTPSQRSSIAHYSPKEQLSRCLEQYHALGREGLDLNSAKEAVFWCCLGLGAVACSQLSITQQSPLSVESRSSSTHSLDTISDSGFAPSFETPGRHCLSVDDPDLENSITNLVGGIVGVFTSGLLAHTNAPHSLSLPDVGQDFVTILSHFGLAQSQRVESILPFVAKVSAQLLSALQDGCDVSDSTLSYWILCLKFIVSSTEEDVQTSNLLRSQLISRNPPHSLAEPARSLIAGASFQGGALGLIRFPNLDSNPVSPISPHIAARFQRQTRSRAASLMSHSSLRSFSSVRSLGALSPKSPATLSLSSDFRVGERPLPSGSFIVGSSGTALGTLDSLAEDLQVRPRRREPLSPESRCSATAPSSPRRTMLSRTTSDHSTNGQGKGKENTVQLPREGLRPGTANLSVRTGTRFAVTSPPTPSGLGRRLKAEEQVAVSELCTRVVPDAAKPGALASAE
ncbi:unnamed protein product [Rhizoctonia solani]|uniref:Uncharacterized protein n=1 Tax=Rhizoctonia solani TaxID=456999 RepID=A0A8H2W9K1_9AGAM|nr:unnamed protein product [Rhizoctonia solani]